MYHLRKDNIRQKSIGTKSNKINKSTCINIGICIYWLNPLLHKCDGRLHLNVF